MLSLCKSPWVLANDYLLKFVSKPINSKTCKYCTKVCGDGSKCKEHVNCGLHLAVKIWCHCGDDTCNQYCFNNSNISVHIKRNHDKKEIGG